MVTVIITDSLKNLGVFIIIYFKGLTKKKEPIENEILIIP